MSDSAAATPGAGDARAARLRSAGDAARQEGGAPPGEAVLPCQRGQALEVRVLDERGGPVADVVVELARGQDQVLRRRSDARGRARFEGLEPGAALKLSLPLLDAEAWEPIADAPLAAGSVAGAGEAAWQPPPADTPAATTHALAQGECLASVACRHGFYPDTLWDHPDNAQLKGKRASYYVLRPGDVVAIPVPRRGEIDAVPGRRYDLRRRGVPEELRVRFVDFAGQPRAGVPYLLTIHAADGEPLADRTGETDADGFVVEPIPPDAESGRLALGRGSDLEVHEFDLGFVNPVDDLAGVQARLNNLNYPCGPEDGVPGERTRAALLRFQADHGLPATGEPDDATRAKLEELHLS